jgi:hypothetical protein
MDKRVVELIDELGSQHSDIDVKGFRDKIVHLYESIDDEQTRITLIKTYIVLMDMAERSAVSQRVDPAPLRNLRTAEMRLFCIREASGDDGNIDPNALHRVVQREVEAGRLEQDDFAHLAEDGAVVLGNANSQAKRRGLWRRLFG